MSVDILAISSHGLLPSGAIGEGTSVYPDPDEVLAGIVYGPNGTDFTGEAPLLTDPTEYPNADDTHPIEIITDTIDFKDRGLKTITFLEVGFTGITDLAVSVYYRYDDSESFTQSDSRSVDAKGIAYIGITAKDFRIAFSGTSSATAKLDYTKVHYKMSDRRYVRGIG